MGLMRLENTLTEPGQVRQMSRSEVTSLYLPLRRSVYDEYNWAKRKMDGESWDSYDEIAIHYGYFLSNYLAGAFRLIVAPTIQELPSGSNLQGIVFPGRVGEFSKGMVASQFRGKRVFVTLLRFGLSEARALGISHVFLSAFDTGRLKRFYARFGFTTVGVPFRFEDENIHPSEGAIVFHKQLDELT